MENGSIWLTIAIGVAVTVIGTILNTLITNKINEGNKKDAEIEAKQKEDRELFFKRMDDIKENYVRKDMYDQAMQFHQKETDSKFNNLVESMNKQFDNVEKNIEDVKKLINEKLTGKNKGE